VKEYDLFIPLYYNDGVPVEPARFQDLQRRLLEQFEGLTYFPQPNQGFWKFGNKTYRDEIVIYRVITLIHLFAFISNRGKVPGNTMLTGTRSTRAVSNAFSTRAASPTGS